MKAKLSVRTRLVILVGIAIFPAIVFYSFLLRGIIDVPFRDDYDTILGFSNGLIDQASFHGRCVFFLAAQSNEYKLYLLHALVWIQTLIWHEINFRALALLGDAFVVLIAAVLWKIFLPQCKNMERRLALFFPVSCLLFQLRYEETLDWSTACLQHLPCIFFSFLTIFLLQKKSAGAFLVSLISLIFAISSSGNGFIVTVVGVLVLASTRQFVRMLPWIAITACCIAAYAYKWTPRNLVAKTSLHDGVVHFRFDYILLFVGSVAARPNLRAGVVLGGLILAVIAYFVYRRYPVRNPAVAWCVLYLLLTAIGVAGLRGDVDPVQISTSRYTIYSALFLIFCWFAASEIFLEAAPKQLFRKPLFLVATVCSVLFTMMTWHTGLRGIEKHDEEIIRGMKAFEHPTESDPTFGPVLPLDIQNAELDAFDIRARAELITAIEKGIYIPASF